MHRHALSLLAALFMAACAQTSHAVEIVAGPMVGHVSARSARMWMQFSLAGQVTITTYNIARPEAVSSIKVDVEGPLPFVCDVPVNNLQPNTAYRIEVKFDGQPVRLPGPDVVIRTAPAPGEEAIFAVAFGGNLGDLPMPPLPAQDNNGAKNPAIPVPTIPPATSRKIPLPIMSAVTDLKPRAFLFLGNTGYLPPKLEEFPTLKKNATRYIKEFHSRVRRIPDLQNLLRTTACYSVFSDRDFGPLNADSSFVFAQESLTAFQGFWPNPDWGSPDAPGCFTNFTLGDVDFFLLDTRTYRHIPANAAPAANNVLPPIVDKTLLGPGQLDWFKKNLKESKATFKVLAAPCALFGDDPAHPDADSWSQFPQEQRDFLNWLATNKINGVVALAGGLNAGQLTKLDPNLAPNLLHYPLYTLGTSALSPLPNAAPMNPEPANPRRVGNVITQNNFGTLDFGGTGEHRFVTLRLRDAKGTIRIEQTLFAVQLHN